MYELLTPATNENHKSVITHQDYCFLGRVDHIHHSPNAVGHLEILVPINLEGQFKLAVEAALSEDALQEGVEQTLVKLIVNAATIDGLGHQCF